MFKYMNNISYPNGVSDALLLTYRCANAIRKTKARQLKLEEDRQRHNREMEILKVKAQCSPMKITTVDGFTVEGPVSEVMKCVKVFEKCMQQRALHVPYKQQKALPYKVQYTPLE